MFVSTFLRHYLNIIKPSAMYLYYQVILVKYLAVDYSDIICDLI